MKSGDEKEMKKHFVQQTDFSRRSTDRGGQGALYFIINAMEEDFDDSSQPEDERPVKKPRAMSQSTLNFGPRFTFGGPQPAPDPEPDHICSYASLRLYYCFNYFFYVLNY